jgi:hypothetical protein
MAAFPFSLSQIILPLTLCCPILRSNRKDEGENLKSLIEELSLSPQIANLEQYKKFCSAN